MISFLIGAGVYLAIGYVFSFFWERNRLNKVKECMEGCRVGDWCGRDSHDEDMTSMLFMCWPGLVIYAFFLVIGVVFAAVIKVLVFLWDNLGPGRAAQKVAQAQERKRGVVIIPGNNERD